MRSKCTQNHNLAKRFSNYLTFHLQLFSCRRINYYPALFYHLNYNCSSISIIINYNCYNFLQSSEAGVKTVHRVLSCLLFRGKGPNINYGMIQFKRTMGEKSCKTVQSIYSTIYLVNCSENSYKCKNCNLRQEYIETGKNVRASLNCRLYVVTKNP